MKSAIASANAGYEQFIKGVRQAADATEVNMNTTVNQVSQDAKRTTGNTTGGGARKQ
jgi:protoporphyrinogen oxidase